MGAPYRFGRRSAAALSTCDPRLRRLFRAVIREVDCSVLCGHRTQEDQDAAVEAGNSRAPWPTSKHNAAPSLAADVVPYPIDWQDTERMRLFGEFVRGVALGLDIPIRWGGDWDGDHDLADQRFDDLPHFELRI